MGTNYYIKGKECNECGHISGEYHIGKSSAGWCFALHVEPDEGIHNLNDIMVMWKDKVIVDECEDEVDEFEMLDIIFRQGQSRNVERKPCGYKSWTQFHEENGSQMGPRGFLRSRIDGVHCIGHGDGAYDLIVGEFS